jgi:hypothetical protein
MPCREGRTPCDRDSRLAVQRPATACRVDARQLGAKFLEFTAFAAISRALEVDSLPTELQLSTILPAMNNGYRDGTARHRVFCSRR